jgi:DNA-binding transcriptional LysR family regulator
MDRLKAIEAFVAVADLGSFRRAAARLRLSPAMATTHINRLEEELGVRLIARTTRRLDLTERGVAFLHDARHILDLVRAAETSVRSGAARPAGRVRIDAPASLGTLYLLPALTGLRAAYPEIVIDLTLGDRGTVYRADGFDLLVRVGEAPLSERVSLLLGETRFALVAAEDYLARRGCPETPEAVLDHDCILYSSVEAPGGGAWRFLKDGASRIVRPTATFTFNDGRAISDAAIAGLGIAQTLEMLVHAPLADRRLVPVLDDWCGATAPVVLTCTRDRHELPAVRAVMEHLAYAIDWRLGAVPVLIG